MNKLSALALGTALAFSAPLAATAQGLDLGVELDGDVGVELGGDDGLGVDVGVGADAGAGVDELTHADVDAAIQSSASVNLDDVDATTDVEIVAISSLAANDGGDASVIADTRAAFDADISALQDEISANAELVAALDAQGYAADDVIAVRSHGTGSVVLFVDA